MLTPLGRFVAGHARAVLLATLVFLVGAAFIGLGAFGKLQDGGFDDPASESSRAAALIERDFDGRTDVVFLVRAHTGTVDSAGVAAAGTALATALKAEPDVTAVTSYWQTKAPALRTPDGEYALVLVNGGDAEELIDTYRGERGDITVGVGGTEGTSSDLAGQIGRDLGLAEGIAVPIILLLLVFAFRTVVAALLPLAIGVIAIFGTFALLSVLGSNIDVSIYAVNLTTALGLGLAVDYALLMVSRFREELTDGTEPRDAVVRTMRTAGRTIVFSAATVAAALAVLMIFPLYFLRSFAYAAMGVVAISTLAALVVLPALLTVLGHRVNALRLPWSSGTPSTEAPFWGRLAGLVWRRPVIAALPVLVILAVAALPLTRVEFGTPDDRVLPTSIDSRQVGDVLRTEFDTDATAAMQLVSTGPVTRSELSEYAAELAALPGVARVESSAGVFVARELVTPTPADAGFSRPSGERLAVVTTHDSHSTAAKDLVAQVRAVPPPAGADVLVGGQTANLVDTLHAIGSRLPLAVGIIIATTFLLLFLFTGSLVQPLRSLVLNSVTLAATLGAMVFVFQEGHLASLLGFTPMPLDTSMLLLLFCVAFGLSMDYEVFVLSRIKELRDAGADDRTAVTTGLARTGRIVSMAAVLLAVNFFAFGTAQISFLQLFGLGTGLAILVDATLVRGVLVPALLRLLGRAAWWSPPRLRLLHNRVGLPEAS